MKRKAFTLVEMLAVIVIIGIMAGMAFGAYQLARASAHEAATKATIAKLNNIIMRQLD
jgi:prepilin-type N-terminal cleavage/methylation domain-containing protein